MAPSQRSSSSSSRPKDVSKRRINFHAPLLSTKRQVVEEETTSSKLGASDAASKIPFSWEEVPGVPKDLYLQRSDQHENETPRLKLPPGRLSIPQSRPDFLGHDREENGDDIAGRIDALSDAMDVLSLTEAIDIAQKTQKSSNSEPDMASNTKNTDHSDSNGYLTLESVEHCSGLSPSYIIERFLPDAAALAASSALVMSKKLNKSKVPYLCNYPDKPHVRRAVRDSYESTKGCGLQKLLPWRVKQRICGVKSSVTEGSQLVVKPKSKGRRSDRDVELADSDSRGVCT